MNAFGRVVPGCLDYAPVLSDFYIVWLVPRTSRWTPSVRSPCAAKKPSTHFSRRVEEATLLPVDVEGQRLPFRCFSEDRIVQPESEHVSRNRVFQVFPVGLLAILVQKARGSSQHLDN